MLISSSLAQHSGESWLQPLNLASMYLRLWRCGPNEMVKNVMSLLQTTWFNCALMKANETYQM